MAIKYILFFLYITIQNPLYCNNDIINTIDKNFKKSIENKIDKITQSNLLYKKESFLDTISREIWASVEAKSPSTIYPQDLEKSKEVLKIKYKKEVQSYRGTIDYIDSIINKEFTNYLLWVIIIQSFVIIFFIILYMDINFKIKKLQNKEQIINNTLVNKDIPEEKNNLRKALL
jgi:hypothetical protein